MFKRVTIAAAAAALVGAFALAPAAANAATNPYTAAQVCGSGFRELSHHAVTDGTVTYGNVYLMYKSTTKVYCAVTLKTIFVGQATSTSAFLQRSSGAKSEDDGEYKYYADTKLQGVAGQCVHYEGWIFSDTDHDGVGTWYSSPLTGCI